MQKAVLILTCVFLLANPHLLSGIAQTTELDNYARATVPIYNVSDLQNISTDLAGTYELVNDIDASATVSWNTGSGFIPLGSSSIGFTGLLDGKGYGITGLCINRSGTDYVGLFGVVSAGGQVKNLCLQNCTVVGNRYVGGLAGTNSGTLANSYVVGIVGGSQDIGGLVGLNAQSVDGSFFAGSVTGTRSNIGGLVGVNGGTVNNSHAEGNVAGTRMCLGGLVAYNDKGVVNNSYSKVNLSGSSFEVGGLVGENNQGTVNNSVTRGNVDGTGDYVGGIVGYQRGGLLNNTDVLGTVYGPGDYVGGLVGFIFFGNLDKSSCHGNVTGRGRSVGGLVGQNKGTVSSSRAFGNVTGYSTEVGGLVGFNNGGAVKDSTAAGKVIGTSNWVGGLVGQNYRGTVDGAFAMGDVAGASYVGGLVGNNDFGVVSNSSAAGNATGSDGIGGLIGDNVGSVSGSYSTGSVSGARSVGGLIGGGNSGTMYNSHYNIDKVSIKSGFNITLGGLFESQYQDWFSSGFALNISDYSASLVPSDGCFNIRNASGLRDLLGFADEPGFKFRLTANIDLGDDPGLYIPYLAAGFDGNNHTISGVYVDIPYNQCLGMFGEVKGGTIENLRVIVSRIRGYSLVGGLAGTLTGGMISNSSSDGTVTGANHWMGGLIGASSGTVYMSHSTATVTGGTYSGGLAGANDGAIVDSYSAGTVTGSGGVIGSLVGHNNGIINASFSTGAVTGAEDTGGLVGLNDGLLFDSYATGKVSGTRNVGGLVGRSRGTVNISYSTGKASGVSNVGGLVGWKQSGTADNSFWDNETSALKTSDCGTGKYTTEMKKRGTFTDAGWDFSGVWFIMENSTYPILSWQDKEPPQAYAGGDRTVNEDTTLMFDGSGSSDNYGIDNYTWDFVDGVPVKLFGVQPEYKFENPGTFAVTLTVTDIGGKRSTDSVIITVKDITVPIADAGPDLTIDEGALVTLDGDGSSDNAGIVNYSWAFKDKWPVALFGVKPDYMFDNAGRFIVTLTVKDAAGNWDSDSMNITVNDLTVPVAEAGPDQTIGVGSRFVFDGSGSTDNVGVANYTWTFTDRGPVTLYGIRPEYVFDEPGTFVVTLCVTDEAGWEDTVTVIVTVKDLTPPIAKAGPDQKVDEGKIVIFDGSGSSDNIGIFNYSWTFTDNGQVVLYSDRQNYKFDHPGIFVVTLNVTDAAGNWNVDNLTVTVNDKTPPIASAGQDQKVGAGTVVNFDAAGSRDNVGIAKYFWNFTYDGRAMSLDGEKTSFKFEKGGTYKVVLTVIDGAGNRGEDTVIVTVGSSIFGGGGSSSLTILLVVIVIIAAAGIGGFVAMRRRKSRLGGTSQVMSPTEEATKPSGGLGVSGSDVEQARKGDL